MRDALDAGFTYKKAALNLRVWFEVLDTNSDAVGTDRMAQLNALFDKVQHLPVKTDPSTILLSGDRNRGIGPLSAWQNVVNHPTPGSESSPGSRCQKT